MAKDLLLEIGTEEIPAGFVNRLLGIDLFPIELLKNLVKQEIDKYNLIAEADKADIDCWGTPRRLVVYVKNLPEKQPDVTEEKLGPAKRIAYDKDGKPTKAAIGFAKGQGVDVTDLKIKQTEKGEYICAVKKIQGRPTKELLPEVLSQIIHNISFPKSMRWGNGDFRFARPIHWVVALYDKNKIEFSTNDIKSDHYSYGHRFLSTNKLLIPSPDRYLSTLEENKVLVDHKKRKENIKRQLKSISQQLAEKHSGAHIIEDEELLNEVNCLVEYPVAVMGHFDKNFLELPREVLTTTLKHHQKCFSAEDGNGNLLPVFITISNMPDDKGYIRQGNERVIRARLADARFFFEEDKKKPLESKLEQLKGMIFQEKLGTYYDKAKRLEELAGFIAQSLGCSEQEIDCAKRAGLLCKCDLVTEMVGEFPELQGIMGSYYAYVEKHDAMVCKAIREQYKFDIFDLPSELPSIAVNIADKIDSIVGYIGVGILPSGSQDPYAIRRQAMSIIDILLQRDAHLSRNNLINNALKLYGNRITRTPDEIHLDIERLFRQRLETHFKGQYRYDLVDAVLSAGFDDVLDAKQRLEVLKNLSQEADFDSLMTGFRRVARIIPPDYSSAQVAADLFQEEGEELLYRRFREIKDQVEQLLDQRDYNNALYQLAGLRPDVDRFFDEVLVMAEDESLRNNRLALLSEIKTLFSRIADFSKIVIQ
jgi:glycyl-tRNA synthetase beta chain